MGANRGKTDVTRRVRAEVLSRPRAFRPRPRLGELLAIRPEALDADYLWTGVRPNDRTKDGVAIVHICGPLEHHASWFWDSYEAILERLDDAFTGMDVVKEYERRNRYREGYEPKKPEPSRGVILRIDSPGGDAAGCTYAHKKILALRKKYGVPLYAYADEMACSAAYEIASACDEIWLPKTGMVGSIGVVATLFDRTRANEKDGFLVELVTSGEYKADGHADRPLDDGIRERMQSRVFKLARIFWEVVAKQRGTSPKAIKDLKAGVFVGDIAVSVGVADGVAWWDKFLRVVSRSLDAAESAAESDEAAATAA